MNSSAGALERLIECGRSQQSAHAVGSPVAPPSEDRPADGEGQLRQVHGFSLLAGAREARQAPLQHYVVSLETALLVLGEIVAIRVDPSK
jgi:hypothetical protein